MNLQSLRSADRIIFSFPAGEGFSQNEINLDDYLQLVNKERENFFAKDISK